ncbi:tyrosine-type recombinase/integrase [Prolixibacter sp. NT017]|uniref:tyrosine-type recombinase/integrase n=1 Tax=Prolixibacter sp. NT017 TaxID=2652390 RepID=UPI001298F6D1|nr:tyrosine-type recombinase/integrase [Prolixibacter sp. NT017]
MKRKVMTATLGVHFVIRKSKLIGGKAPIYARVTVNKERCEISIKKFVDVKVWNPQKGRGRILADEYKNLTFHLSRHTFATTITLCNGVPIESVGKMLGHSKLSTTQIYAKVVETKLGKEMSKLRDKLGE